MQIVVLNLKGLFEIAQGTPQLLGSSEDACEVVVCHSSEAVTILCESLSLP